jgi:hypothetical protein
MARRPLLISEMRPLCFFSGDAFLEMPAPGEGEGECWGWGWGEGGRVGLGLGFES